MKDCSVNTQGILIFCAGLGLVAQACTKKINTTLIRQRVVPPNDAPNVGAKHVSRIKRNSEWYSYEDLFGVLPVLEDRSPRTRERTDRLAHDALGLHKCNVHYLFSKDRIKDHADHR